MMRSVKSDGLFLYITAHEIVSRKHYQPQNSTLRAKVSTSSATAKHVFIKNVQCFTSHKPTLWQWSPFP